MRTENHNAEIGINVIRMRGPILLFELLCEVLTHGQVFGKETQHQFSD